jgi:hypothetical protein
MDAKIQASKPVQQLKKLLERKSEEVKDLKAKLRQLGGNE